MHLKQANNHNRSSFEEMETPMGRNSIRLPLHIRISQALWKPDGDNQPAIIHRFVKGDILRRAIQFSPGEVRQIETKIQKSQRLRRRPFTKWRKEREGEGANAFDSFVWLEQRPDVHLQGVLAEVADRLGLFDRTNTRIPLEPSAEHHSAGHNQIHRLALFFILRADQIKPHLSILCAAVQPAQLQRAISLLSGRHLLEPPLSAILQGAMPQEAATQTAAARGWGHWEANVIGRAAVWRKQLSSF